MVFHDTSVLYFSMILFTLSLLSPLNVDSVLKKLPKGPERIFLDATKEGISGLIAYFVLMSQILIWKYQINICDIKRKGLLLET